MIVDIFYPIFTLTIIVLACFIRKKNCSGVLHPRLHQGIALDPLGGLQFLPDPQLQSFLALPKTDALIHSLSYCKSMHKNSLWYFNHQFSFQQKRFWNFIRDLQILQNVSTKMSQSWFLSSFLPHKGQNP